MAFEPTDPRDRPEEVVERRETMQFIQGAIAELPVDFRTVIVLRDLQGLTYEEIARTLECAVGTVKSRLFRARESVKAKLISRGLACVAVR